MSGVPKVPGLRPGGDPLRIQTEKRALPVELTPEELAAEAQRLAGAVEAVAEQEEKIAEAKGVWAEKKKSMEGYLAHLKETTNDLAAVVDSGTAEQDVECSWLYSLGSGYAFLVRDDTGDLVHNRKLGDAERQTDLLEVIREPTPEQLASWIETLGLVVDPQADLPLAAPDSPVYYYRDFNLTMEGGDERVTGRFTEADHRPASLSGVYSHGEPPTGTGLPEQIDRSALQYDEREPILKIYRQALEDLLAARQAEALATGREADPTGEPRDQPPPARSRKGGQG